MSITRFTKDLVETAIKEEQTLDKGQLTYAVSDILIEKYDTNHLETLLERIGLETTKNIHDAIDEYIEKNPKRLKEMGLM